MKKISFKEVCSLINPTHKYYINHEWFEDVFVGKVNLTKKCIVVLGNKYGLDIAYSDEDD